MQTTRFVTLWGFSFRKSLNRSNRVLHIFQVPAEKFEAGGAEEGFFMVRIVNGGG